MKSFLIPLTVLTFFVSSAFAAKKPLDNIELKFKATTGPSELIATKLGLLSAKVSIDKFKDSRTVNPKNKIGENKEHEEKGIILPVTTSSDISAFVTENFMDTLKQTGLEIVQTNSNFVLTGEITDYFVTEINTYQGNLTVRMTLSKDGKVIWKSTITGTNKRFGRSYSLENYLETLSDTIVEFTTGLAKDPEFIEKLKTSK
ncbi:MAG: hypothetical protein WA160_04730 [Pseudobdellovibrio sp.]